LDYELPVFIHSAGNKRVSCADIGVSNRFGDWYDSFSREPISLTDFSVSVNTGSLVSYFHREPEGRRAVRVNKDAKGSGEYKGTTTFRSS